MPRSSSTSSSEARPWLLAALAVALIEGGLALAGPRAAPIDVGLRFYGAATEPTISESMVQWQVSRIDALDAPADVLVLGDSSALTSVVPPELGAALGLRVENLGTIAPLHVSGHVRVLERYLTRIAQPPRAVIYHFSDGSFATTLADVEKMGALPALEDWLGVAPLQRLGPPGVHLRPWARAAIGGGRYPSWENDQRIGAFIRRTHGFLREPDKDYDWATFERLQVPLHPDALDPLGRLIGLTADRGITLLLARAPVPAIAADPASTAEHAANAEFFRRIASAHPRIHVAEPYLRVLPNAAFGTPNHPRLPAAQANTRWLAEVLQPLLAADGQGQRE